MRETVFSKYEMRKMGVKVKGDEGYTSADCVGSWEEELDVIVVVKKCRGVEVLSRPRGAGTGTCNYTGHFPYGIYQKIFDTIREDLIKGVQGYGTQNFHKEFAIVADVYNEENEECLLAYPRCIVAVGPNTTITNGEEEVAEIELEIKLMPDDNGYCRYECIVSDLAPEDAEIATKWMTEFTPELVGIATTA